MPTIDMINSNNNNTKSPIPGSPQLRTSSGLQCLWCQRCYHRRCWEQVFSNDERHQCDYGAYRYFDKFFFIF